MPKTITISDELYARLEALAQPFVDREPQDVIRRLVEGESTMTSADVTESPSRTETKFFRVPRERGAVVELNGKTIIADTVPDLCTKVMEFIDLNGLWDKLEALTPYVTSSKRYLTAKTPKHPRGNDFFVPIKYRNIFMEGHKNYQTTIGQLKRLLVRLGIDLVYRSA
jgi:hypothetical protein